MLIKTTKMKLVLITTPQEHQRLVNENLKLTYRADSLESANNDNILGIFIVKI